MNAVLDDLLIRHLNFEKEQIHLLTTLYGVLMADRGCTANLEIAKSFELVKSATLILDDFIDKSSYRNGIPSFYSLYGGEQASLISEILKSTATIAFCEGLRAIPDMTDAKQHECLLIFEDTYRTVCLGQLDDIKSWNSNKLSEATLTEKDYFNLIEKTTAVFIRLPLLIGSILNDYSISEREALSNYGLYIGLAYQIRDDIIDIVGDPKVTGKPLGGDIKEGKIRLPIIYLFKYGSRQDIKKMKHFLGNSKISNSEINEAVGILTSCGAINYCNEKTSWLCKKAINQLDNISDNRVRKQLGDIAEFLVPIENDD